MPLGLSPPTWWASASSPAARRAAYALADHFRRRGIPVVLGGVHVTILPGEAAPSRRQPSSSAGENAAGRAWSRISGRGALQPGLPRGASRRRRALRGVPTPRRDLQRRSGYMMPEHRPGHARLQARLRLLLGAGGLAALHKRRRRRRDPRHLPRSRADVRLQRRQPGRRRRLRQGAVHGHDPAAKGAGADWRPPT